jgi:hypothetical protein
MEIVMEIYRQDSVCTNLSHQTPAIFTTLTPAETATYRSWRRAVLAFYCSVLVCGGFALVISLPTRHQEVAQVMPAVNVP